MAWDANFYENLGGKKPVAKFLRDLSVKARAKCMKYIAMLETHGFSLPRQYLEKVRGELWALRPEYDSNEYRIIFFFHKEAQAFIVLHAIHKTTQRIPEGDIDTAESRMDDWLIREAGKEKQ
jgi:phage-related protein